MFTHEAGGELELFAHLLPVGGARASEPHSLHLALKPHLRSDSSGRRLQGQRHADEQEHAFRLTRLW